MFEKNNPTPHSDAELFSQDAVEVSLVAPNHPRLLSIEEQLVYGDDSRVRAIGADALRALYQSQHIDTLGSGQFWMTHDHGQPTLY